MRAMKKLRPQTCLIDRQYFCRGEIVMFITITDDRVWGLCERHATKHVELVKGGGINNAVKFIKIEGVEV